MPASLKLSADQRAQVAAADDKLVGAMCELGNAYLRHARAKEMFEKAQAHLHSCANAAHQAEASKARVMSQIAEGIDFPDGNYEYEPVTGAFLKKD